MLTLFLVTALANAIWQPALIAGVTWLALRLSQCSNATTRHAVWTIALIASVAVPVVSAVPVLRSEQPVPNTFSSAGTVKMQGSRVQPAREQAQSLPPVQTALQQVSRPKFAIPQTLAYWIAGVWVIAALVILVRLAFSFFYLERLKHDALPFPVDRRHLLGRWDKAEKGSRDVRICVTSETSVPIAVGIFDAMILLPSDLVDELDANDLDRILLHELAHVRRSDDWVNLFERIALALLFFSPGIYWIARQMDLEREVACDDWVLEQAAENVPYAKCLARIVEMTQWPYRAMAAPGVFVTRKSMSIRIERLLARGRDIRIRLALVPSLTSIVAIVGIVVAGGFVSPTIAYTLNQDIPLKQVASTVKPVAKPQPKAVASAAPVPAAVITQVQRLQTTIQTQVRTQVSHAVAPRSIASLVAANAQPQTSASSEVASAGYLDELNAAGFTHLDPEEVIEMKSVGITGDYIRGMRNAGLGDASARLLIELKSVGVTPEYIAEMRRDGLTAQSPREWVELKSVGVTPDYVAQMRSAGLTAQDVRGWVEMKSVGVTPDYVADLARAGYPHLSYREYTEMRSVGVDGAYVADLAKHGFTHLSVRKLIEYKSMGIEK